MERFRESIRELIVETSTNLPPDVRHALREAMAHETPGSRSALALRTIAVNVDRASQVCGPICQDTGTPTFELKVPPDADQFAMSEAIGEAVADATRQGILRPDAVQGLTGRNSGDNLGEATPGVHFEEWLSDEIEVRLILKGGGSENVSMQFALPRELPILGQADRDLDGVRKCVVYTVHQAQGLGCSAGILGVAIGGDREQGFRRAKQQLFRTLDDVNPDPALDQLERDVVREANSLGIGSIGLGGAVTLLGCKVAAFHRVPASFFVTVAYSCWALRRLGCVLDPASGSIRRWLYRDSPAIQMLRAADVASTGLEISLTAPLSEGEARSLRVGDVVLLNGPLHTARDAVHRQLASHEAPVDLEGGVLYHCGPIAVRDSGRWLITAAGPSTSLAHEAFAGELIRRFGLRALIGKGGMGARTRAALAEHGAVYLSAIGGAAQHYAQSIVAVDGVDFPEFGLPEAMWHLRVRGFRAIVTMDSHGRSLHDEVGERSAEALARLAEPVKR